MSKLILACVAACTALAGSAQIIRSTTSERSFTPTAEPVKEGFSNYKVLALSYDHTSFSFNKQAGGSDSNFGTNGIGLNFIKGYSVSHKLPLYVEWGINASFVVRNDSETIYGQTITSKNRFLSFGVPVNVAYRYGITNNFFVKPYLGINFRVNAVGETRMENGSESTEWYDIFSSSDGNESHWNRFQMGWQIGASLEYGALYFGLQYGTDFIGAYSYESAKVNTGTFKLLLGVSF